MRVRQTISPCALPLCLWHAKASVMDSNKITQGTQFMRDIELKIATHYGMATVAMYVRENEDKVTELQVAGKRNQFGTVRNGYDAREIAEHLVSDMNTPEDWIASPILCQRMHDKAFGLFHAVAMLPREPIEESEDTEPAYVQ
jgi:glutamine amidotransferase PdxT